ncbi:MAG: hypothetical protein R3F59_24435 [Myxococcota bacterium]
MRRIAWLGALALGCKAGAPPDLPSLPLDPRAGCVATETNTWNPSRNDSWVETLAYDAFGSLVSREYVLEGPGTDFLQTWVRRPDGDYEEYVVDLAIDGTVDEREVYTWDGADVVLWEHDVDGDGTVDDRSEFDSEGGLVLEERYDFGADGSFDSRFAFTYDEGGHNTEITRDDGLDGSVEWLAEATWDGDLLLQYTEDEAVDGGYERFDLYEYDDAGHRVRWEAFDAARIDDTIVWTYDFLDGDDQPDSGTYRSTSAGALYTGATWAILRDEAGRPTQELWFLDYDDDGEPDATLTSGTVWDCGG